jgi:hypothetical protein
MDLRNAVLEVYEKDHDLGTEIAALRKNLHERMMMHQFKQQAVILKSRWSAMQKLQSHQPTVYESSLNLLLGDVMTARVALALEGIHQPLYDELESDLRRAAMSIAVQTVKGQEERQAKARRDYQKWALTEIKSFENTFQAIANKADEEASLWKRDHGGWVETSYQEVREAMLSYLLSIDIMLLDLPVQERYQRAFQNGWKKLDGRQDQTEVAEQTAVIVKRSLRTFLEDML